MRMRAGRQEETFLDRSCRLMAKSLTAMPNSNSKTFGKKALFPTEIENCAGGAGLVSADIVEGRSYYSAVQPNAKSFLWF